MTKKVVRQDGFSIEVNRPGSPPADDVIEEYLKARDLDGAVFFRSRNDDQPVAFGSRPEAESDRLQTAMQQVLVDEVTSGLLDSFKDINIKF